MDFYKNIEKRLEQPGLVEKLAGLSGSELNTLLMEVFRLQSEQVKAPALVAQLINNRFTMPASIDPLRLRELEIEYLTACKNAGFKPVQLGPLAPLGSCSATAPVSQLTIMPALRNTEVVSDITNILAILISRDARSNPEKTEVIRYAATQRQVRGQAFDRPGFSAHFSIIGMATGGWDQGDQTFESEAFTNHVMTHLHLLQSRFTKGKFSINLYWRNANETMRNKVLSTLGALSSRAEVVQHHDDGAFSYYPLVQFKIMVELAGHTWELADGGLVPWTQVIIPNRKHRLMISGAGLDMILHADKS